MARCLNEIIMENYVIKTIGIGVGVYTAAWPTDEVGVKVQYAAWRGTTLKVSVIRFEMYANRRI